VDCILFWPLRGPAGVNSNNNANAWNVNTTGNINNNNVNNTNALRPVLNLKADTAVTGTGDSNNHWVVAN